MGLQQIKEIVMAEQAKQQREEKKVKMSDGREVVFVGKRRLLKETLLDESKISIDEKDGLVMLKSGAVAVRLDFVNGETRTWTPPLGLIAKSVGHGLEQKLGDQTSGEDDVDDCVIAVDDLLAQLDKGDWTTKAEGGGFSGASVVVRAIMEASGKPIDVVKNFLNGKLEAAKAKGEKLSRKELYDSFRKPGTKTGEIVKRLEEEKASKATKIDADAALDEMA
jgi:hypothetical protein